MKSYEKKEVANFIRKVLAENGCETGCLTDDQLIDGVSRCAVAISNAIQKALAMVSHPQAVDEIKKMVYAEKKDLH